MEPWTDWLTEERHLNGMVDLLKGMLQHLGVRPEHVQFTAQIRRYWDPAVVMLYIDAVQTAAPGVPFPAVHLVATSPTVPWGIQKAAISAIKVIGRDYRAYLQHSEFTTSFHVYYPLRPTYTTWRERCRRLRSVRQTCAPPHWGGLCSFKMPTFPLWSRSTVSLTTRGVPRPVSWRFRLARLGH